MCKSSKSILLGLAIIVALGTVSQCWAGAFINALASNNINNAAFIMHPKGYTGAAGVLLIELCIDPTSANADAMITPVANIASTLNGLAGQTGNLTTSWSRIPPRGGGDMVPGAEYDFESVALHEVGHCLGLAHPNAATESGLPVADTEYTKAGDGADDTFDLGVGGDTIRGSNDDARNDDVNVHWFRTTTNDPCNAPPNTTFDNTTYTNLVGSLPGGHTFAANAETSVCAALAAADTEAVMQQGSPNGQAQRRLGHDDEAMLRLAMSGLDETQGAGSDDYTINVVSLGKSTSVDCDITLDFDITAGFAFCTTGFNPALSANHGVITSASAFFDTDAVTWFFNTTPVQLQSFTVE